MGCDVLITTFLASRVKYCATWQRQQKLHSPVGFPWKMYNLQHLIGHFEVLSTASRYCVVQWPRDWPIRRIRFQASSTVPTCCMQSQASLKYQHTHTLCAWLFRKVLNITRPKECFRCCATLGCNIRPHETLWNDESNCGQKNKH